MRENLGLLKKGNKSALLAAIVNAIISIIKAVAFSVTGNVAMFAETMHSLGDAANQFFVFIGSALSKKAPTKRFPNGFGRLVNLVLLGAVLVVGVMSYETIKEGYLSFFHPKEASGLLINLSVLGAGFMLEGYVLLKAMKEVIHETGGNATGISLIPQSFLGLRKAKPATKLVFMEDLVATSGGLLAIIAILISHFTPFHAAEGIASILIGLMMLFVVGRVFLDNAAGALGEADEEMEEIIESIILSDSDVRDIKEITVIKEGESLHVDIEIELNAHLTVSEANDIKSRLVKEILGQRGVADVTMEIHEDDGVKGWK